MAGWDAESDLDDKIKVVVAGDIKEGGLKSHFMFDTPDYVRAAILCNLSDFLPGLASDPDDRDFWWIEMWVAEHTLTEDDGWESVRDMDSGDVWDITHGDTALQEIVSKVWTANSLIAKWKERSDDPDFDFTPYLPRGAEHDMELPADRNDPDSYLPAPPDS